MILTDKTAKASQIKAEQARQGAEQARQGEEQRKQTEMLTDMEAGQHRMESKVDEALGMLRGSASPSSVSPPVLTA